MDLVHQGLITYIVSIFKFLLDTLGLFGTAVVSMLFVICIIWLFVRK